MMIRSLALLSFVLTACYAPVEEEPRAGLAGPPAVPTRLVAGDYHACALFSDRTARCWGGNLFGELSAELPSFVTRPTEIPGLADVRDFSLADEHSCAIVGDEGRLLCRGSNFFYQLGVEDPHPPQPVEIVGIPPAVEVAASPGCTCILDQAGAVWCWGWCYGGEDLPGVNASPTAEKRRLSFKQRFRTIRDSVPANCGITEAGEAWCWHFHGLVPVSGLNDVAQLSPNCAVDRQQRVFCWGENSSGQLGLGTKGTMWDPPATPRQVPGLQATQVVFGVCSVCAVETDRHLSCWGCGIFDTLGVDNHRDDLLRPGRVPGIENAVSLAPGARDFVCVLLADHSAKCWGYNNEYELGNGPNSDPYSPTPVDVKF